ncbi:MAG: hypothetical protein EOO90_13200 [Pedobacter sp.]|nr:MAG: hypothetical protein EOO90_13200 [Pedobacter sp.]
MNAINKILVFFSLIIFFCLTDYQNVRAQNQKLESAMNQQFGTLLESLLKDGKINNESAKVYVETVFGNNQSVSNYLQTVNFSSHIGHLSKGKLSLDNYLSNINSVLLSLVPESYHQTLMENAEMRMLVNNVFSEIKSGQIGASTMELASGIMASLKETKREQTEYKNVAAKLKVITPTLAKLQNFNSDYKKLTIVDDVDSELSWIKFHNPAKLTAASTTSRTTNQAVLRDGYLLVTHDYHFWSDPIVWFESLRCYKNPERFDFSKDFSMNLHFKISDASSNAFFIDIGKGYKIAVYRNAEGKKGLAITTYHKYETTDKYGILAVGLDKSVKKSKVLIDKNLEIFETKSDISTGVYFSKKVDLDQIFKINITKKGDVFTFKLADLPGEASVKVDMFPDKYFLGFSQQNSNSKKVNEGFAEVHKLELRHL